MALRAGKVELTLAPVKRGAPGVEERLHAPLRRDLDRHSARLPGNMSSERKQLAAFVGQRRRLLAPGAAGVDALLEIHRPSGSGIPGGIARRDTLHARARVAVAAGARLSRRARLAVPQLLAVEQRQHRGVGGVVVLHRAGFRAHELVSGAALRGHALRCARRGGKASMDNSRRDGAAQPAAATEAHATVILADSVRENPLSPVHLNSSVPLAVATVLNVMSGLAAMAGWKSARKISSPL